MSPLLVHSPLFSLPLPLASLSRDVLGRRWCLTHTYGVQNLPFIGASIKNHRTLALKFAFFFAVPFWIPFLNLRFNLKKA